MNAEYIKNKNNEKIYPVAHAQSTVYSETEQTVYTAIENLKTRVTALEERPSGGGFGGTINVSTVSTSVSVE